MKTKFIRKSAIILALLLFGLTTPSNASFLTDNGFEVNVESKYKKKKQKFKAWGTIKSGEPCNRLSATLWFVGTGKRATSFNLQTTIEDYKPTADGMSFSTEKDNVVASKNDQLFTSKVEVECTK